MILNCRSQQKICDGYSKSNSLVNLKEKISHVRSQALKQDVNLFVNQNISP